jgi:DNA replication protein DnaC
MSVAPEALDALITMQWRELKLAGLRNDFRPIARNAASQGQSYNAFLSACLTCEIDSRRRHRLEACLPAARFPFIRTLAAFDFLAIPELPKAKVMALADGSFIKSGDNIVCLGSPATGKTHVAIALGLACLESGYKVRFTSAVTLAQELLAAQAEYRLPRYLKSFLAFDLVILDELGYLGLGPAGPLLFQFCAEMYERRSLCITSNLDFSRWLEVFGDATLSAALLDRLTHHCHVLLFQGTSYRFQQSQDRFKGAIAPTTAA